MSASKQWCWSQYSSLLGQFLHPPTPPSWQELRTRCKGEMELDYCRILQATDTSRLLPAALPPSKETGHGMAATQHQHATEESGTETLWLVLRAVQQEPVAGHTGEAQ